MTEKLSISLTDTYAAMIDDAVASGDYASASEVIREALRDWKVKRRLGLLWDEGLTSERAPLESLDEIKSTARRRQTLSD